MKILNLYAGLGGNRKLWSQDHQVTSIELEQNIADIYQKLFPHDRLIIEDAHQYLLNHFREFDFIWSSPPCQSHSKVNLYNKHKPIRFPDLKLYEEILFLKHNFKGKWIVENVKPYYTPLIRESISMGRHLFWSNFFITPYHMDSPADFINLCTVEGSEKLKEWLDIKYEGNIYYKNNHNPGQVLRNCIHPLTGNHILQCAIDSPKKINELDFTV